MKTENGFYPERFIKQCTAWIKNQIHSAGAKGAVVGLSGGIDSAVVAVLCQKALNGNVLGVLMPCSSISKDAEDAMTLARHFKIKTIKIPLDPVFGQFKKILPKGSSAADSNLKPRLRMTTLYHLAQTRNYLVAGTGNKSEISVGYFTKYGDGGTDLLPIGGIYKTQVWLVAHALGIPRHLVEKPPSAGLWEGQTDEGEMGITYADLDACHAAIEKGCVPKLASRLVSKVKKMTERSEHKRKPIPVFMGE